LNFINSAFASEVCLTKKNLGAFAPGLFFADQRFEISDQRLIRDLANIIKLEMDVSIAE
jgi:hypothetical protein